MAVSISAMGLAMSGFQNTNRLRFLLFGLYRSLRGELEPPQIPCRPRLSGPYRGAHARPAGRPVTQHSDFLTRFQGIVAHRLLSVP